MCKKNQKFFFENLATCLNNCKDDLSDKLLEEFLNEFRNESAIFAKSIQQSLEYFVNDRRAFEIVKHRLQSVIINAIDEFPQK